MLSVIVILILAFAFYSGYRSGMIMQIVRLLGYIITYIIATQYFDVLSKWVEMIIPFPAVQPDSQLALYTEAQTFLLDQTFYKLITFLIIWLIGWLLTNVLSILFTKVTYYSVLNISNRLIGGVLNFAVVYFIVFMVLYLLSLIPIEFIQQQFVNNPLIFRMVDSTPILTDFVGKFGLGS
ncbi:CvpA family protein [Facklamia sp. P12945]|uniref:CvpA family protein n=1 Tax=unclassified Facklamia TaxID=2622293 RepID=UPI003D17E644